VALRTDVGGANAAGTPPLAPFKEVLREVVNRVHEGGRAAAERLLGPRGRVLAAYEPTLLTLPGQQEQPLPPPLSPENARARVIAWFQETIWALSAYAPLVLLLDDLQWIDELSLSLLEALVKVRLEGKGVLLVGTYRSEETRPELEELSRASGVSTITLPRLDPPSVAAMVSDMLARYTLPRPVLDALIEQSRGNPFFVGEYLRAAMGEGMLRRDEGAGFRFEAQRGTAAALSSLSLPRTLAELIERRLALLDEQGRAQVAWCAVLGQEFEGDLALANAEDGAAEAMAALEALRTRQILEETDEGRLRFAHDKIREIAYERISQAERTALHRQAGEALEARCAEEPDMAPTLGHHFAMAAIHDKAGWFFAKAADRAREVYANGEAIRFYRAAIREFSLASPSAARDGALATLHERLGDVLGFVGRHAEAREAYGKALAEAHQDPCLDPARLHRKSGKTCEIQHLYAEALERYALAKAALGDAPHERVDAWWDEWLQIQIERITTYYWLADVERIREGIEAVRPVVELHGTALQRGRFFQSLIQRNLWLERYVPSTETVRWARAFFAIFETASEVHEAHWILTAHCTLAIVLMLHGDLDEAEEQMAKAMHKAERVGDLEMHARCLMYMTVIQRRLGRVDALGGLCERSLSVARAAQMSEYIGAALGNWACLALKRGDRAEAERAAREALSHWKQLSRVYPFEWLARVPLTRGLLTQGNIEGAVEQAKAMLDAQQLRLPRALSGALESAVAAFEEGRPDQARKALSSALRIARRRGFM